MRPREFDGSLSAEPVSNASWLLGDAFGADELKGGELMRSWCHCICVAIRSQ
jgi:hypothetical protein